MKVKNKINTFYAIWDKNFKKCINLRENRENNPRGTLKAIDQFLTRLLREGYNKDLLNKMSHWKIRKFQTVELDTTLEEDELINKRILKEKLKKL